MTEKTPAVSVPAVEDPQGSLPTAHETVAGVLRYLHVQTQKDFAAGMARGEPPPPEVMDIMKAMREALAYYDSAHAAALSVNPKAMLEFALVALDDGDVGAARATIKTLSLAADFMRPDSQP